MKPRNSLLGWWLAGTAVYAIAIGCLAIAFGFIDAWSFGMNGQNIMLFRNRFFFPSQWVVPLPESFDAGHVFLHSTSSGVIYSTVGVGAILAYRAIERFRKGE